MRFSVAQFRRRKREGEIGARMKSFLIAVVLLARATAHASDKEPWLDSPKVPNEQGERRPLTAKFLLGAPQWSE
jgi:hypothetical protein